MIESTTIERVPGGNVRIRVPFHFQHISGRKCFIWSTKLDDATKTAYMRVLKAIATAAQWQDLLISGGCRSIAELAEAVGVDERRVRRHLALAYLSPGIVRRILDGASSGEASEIGEICVARLTEIAKLPWPEQHKQLGIA